MLEVLSFFSELSFISWGCCSSEGCLQGGLFIEGFFAIEYVKTVFLFFSFIPSSQRIQSYLVLTVDIQRMDPRQLYDLLKLQFSAF